MIDIINKEEIKYFMYVLLPKLNKLTNREDIIDLFNQYPNKDLIDDEVELSSEVFHNDTSYFISFYNHLDSYYLEDNIAISNEETTIYVGSIAKIIKAEKQDRIIRLDVLQSFTELPSITRGIIQENYNNLINGSPVQFLYDGTWYTISHAGKKDHIFQIVEV